METYTISTAQRDKLKQLYQRFDMVYPDDILKVDSSISIESTNSLDGSITFYPIERNPFQIVVLTDGSSHS